LQREGEAAVEVKIEVPPLFGKQGLRAISELTALGAYASRRFDVLLNVALTAPLRTRAANVVLLADVTWLKFTDLEDGGRVTTRLWGRIVPPVARRADRLIALTQSGADDIAELLHVDPAKIDVIGLGFDAERRAAASPADELRERLGLGSGPVILNVAAKKAHKNLMRLVEALAELRARVPGAQLVLPGAPTVYEDALRSRAQQLGIADAVAFPGYVSDADLEGLYAIADCFAFPSSNEGFGLPLLEAMARDVPVVCADASALPEVVGDAALLVDPESTTALAGAIGDVLTDPELRARMVAAGRERLPLFTWDRCASETLETLDRAVAQRAAGS
jgi:glycosyltransferase involved in cell wall biosynthesis